MCSSTKENWYKVTSIRLTMHRQSEHKPVSHRDRPHVNRISKQPSFQALLHLSPVRLGNFLATSLDWPGEKPPNTKLQSET